MAAIALALGTPALAEIKEEAFVIGPQQVWITHIDPIEVMWAGPNAHDRTQVPSGDDIETVGFVTDPKEAEVLGARVVVAVVPGTHSCDSLRDPFGEGKFCSWAPGAGASN